MQTAHHFALRATCSRAHVGTVLSREGRILSTGYNGAPAGMPHCDHSCDCADFLTGDRIHAHANECRVLQPCDITVHAEANAVAWAARTGVMTNDSELHTTVSPCLSCAKLLINAGVVRVVYQEQYRDAGGIELLLNAGVLVEDF